ncbi:MAG: hypothetical protein K0R14_1335 [Burkholderiales bacterium]|jgi:uncharacterized membrane-anchored protein|nr:hypothetical protein [Burkholderiales bacterium]
MEILSTIKEFLINTPWYVYLIFLYLIKIGIKTIKGRIISIKKLFFMPCLFLFMSIEGFMTHNIPVTGLFITAFTTGLGLGTIFGYLQYKHLKIEIDQTKRLIKIKGSLFSCILIIVTFAFKYYMGYTFATDLSIATANMAILSFISNILTGMFIGRLLFALKKLKYGPYTNLTKLQKAYL